MTQKTLRAGLIGYGMIGKVHAYATATLPWYAPELPIVGRISAVATSRMETALQAQEQIGCDAAYDDYRRVVEDRRRSRMRSERVAFARPSRRD